MQLAKFLVENNSHLSASDGVVLNLTFTIDYESDDLSPTQILTYTLGQNSGGVTFADETTSVSQEVDTPLQDNSGVKGSIKLQGGKSGTISIKVKAADGSSDDMVINYRAKTVMAMKLSGKKIPVLFEEKLDMPAAKKAGPPNANPKKKSTKRKAAPKKKAAKKKTAGQKAAPKKKAVKKKAAPKKKATKKKTTPRKTAAKKKAAKKPRSRKTPVLWKK
jgi:hypothetical protein